MTKPPKEEIMPICDDCNRREACGNPRAIEWRRDTARPIGSIREQMNLSSTFSELIEQERREANNVSEATRSLEARQRLFPSEYSYQPTNSHPEGPVTDVIGNEGEVYTMNNVKFICHGETFSLPRPQSDMISRNLPKTITEVVIWNTHGRRSLAPLTSKILKAIKRLHIFSWDYPGFKTASGPDRRSNRIIEISVDGEFTNPFSVKFPRRQTFPPVVLDGQVVGEFDKKNNLLWLYFDMVHAPEDIGWLMEGIFLQNGLFGSIQEAQFTEMVAKRFTVNATNRIRTLKAEIEKGIKQLQATETELTKLLLLSNAKKELTKSIQNGLKYIADQGTEVELTGTGLCYIIKDLTIEETLIGDMRVSINFDGLIKIVNLTRKIESYDHPYIMDGNPCFGDFWELLFKGEGSNILLNLGVVYETLMEFLSHYSPSNPHKHLEAWTELGKEMKTKPSIPVEVTDAYTTTALSPVTPSTAYTTTSTFVVDDASTS
tara:strand:- start:10851 stop:12317 length:1467 start_codon:yes stop_codon:yes gene_type:complete